MATVSPSMQLLILWSCVVGTTRGEGEEVNEQGQERTRRLTQVKEGENGPRRASPISAFKRLKSREDQVLCLKTMNSWMNKPEQLKHNVIQDVIKGSLC